MRVIRTDKDISAFVGRLKKRAAGGSPEIRARVSRILSDVRRRGDKAVISYTKRFDRHALKNLRLGVKDIERLSRGAEPKVVKALKKAAERIRRFHERQIERSWTIKEKGISLGQIIRPVARAGIYVPGGKASYPSTVLMNVIPAQAAGVEGIAVCVPMPGGEVNPHVMAAIRLLGVEEVYPIGGAQAVGAMAYGTESIQRVDVIVGPGNIYVALAKKEVFGEVGIDMIAGPSEILVIADKTARPEFVAADLLSQAEHDETASSVLVTDSKELANKVSAELKKRLGGLKRKSIASASLRKYGAIIVVPDLDKAVDVSNQIAPEHLEVMTKNPRKLLPMLKNAGAIFLGHYAAEPLGDYAAGPNHTLPTGLTARFSSPLGVYNFVKRTSLLEFTKEGFDSLADMVETLADIEGLEAHGNSVRIRRG